ncbi:DNA-3-methyladenine glycosylase II [Labedella gwakjiensis]|uniref:DNA-3-methyladenine glycosylase II n=1 Tax=Labedella gwakjiensis TaxID=390269 RepID=A0A2P8GWA6_9MICO|nr:AlkA N-terminal domain-containing protein [Labedella gwakjiensis]PSL38245.1 DNA-3-methyladenine glycosylase II [Labedella gwakjiensis]RUQ87216.1 DNA-3-methyladenine glycosylase 2 family protein [Labedella gwakjiensis]
MDFGERYRVIESRDARFDGRFVTAVRTTGIYCRPSCPARTPKASSVTFYPTSAAAHVAGYRACKRCLPEATPGSPEWNIREDVAARAMRLIADGVVERDGVDGLSRRLGYSARQLNRILAAELGAGPIALARAQRAQNARALITGTTMPMADVAFAAGFTSIRQFNDTVAEVFDLTPSALRARSRVVPSIAGEPAAGTIRLALPYREPLDVDGLFGWFAPRSVPGLETVGPRRYARTVRLPHGAAFVDLSAPLRVDGRPRIDALVRFENLGDLPALLGRVRRLLDLDADPSAVDAVLARDERLAPSVARIPGMRVPGALDAGEMLMRALLGQQVTVASARTQLTRLVEAFGEEASPAVAPAIARPEQSPAEDESPHRLFPAPAAIAEHAHEILRGPAARTDTVRRVAGALADGSLSIDLADTRDDVTERLTAIRGIGPWTADYVVMRALGHPDVFVRRDVAIRSGARALGLPDVDAALAAESTAFAPWRSYLSMHLWRAAADAASRPAPTSTPKEHA